MQIELFILLRLELSSLISFLEDINDQRSDVVEKDDLSKFFCAKGTVIPNARG